MTVQDPSPAIDRFVGQLSQFRRAIETSMTQTNTRLDAIERRSATRLPLATAAHEATPHAKAFAAYLRAGDDTALSSLSPETKAMSSAIAGDGGYLVDPRTAQTIRSVQLAAPSLRSRANLVTVEAGSYDVLIDRTEFGAGWASETSDAAETATPALERISIPLHELSALPKISQRLLDDAAFDLEAWLAERIAERFSRMEGTAFVSGDGNDKPRGILTYPQVDDASWAWGSLGTVPTGAAGAFAATDPGDAIIDLIYALDAPYRANAAFVMNSTTAGVVRKFKDADNRYLWTEATALTEPARLFGYPVLIDEAMPDIAADATAIAFGDLKSAYTIAERPDLRLMRDPFSAKPHVLFYATKRVGGAVTDFAALKLLKFAAA
ncbi:MAG: phage major capsid protein [Neomegalonema sp.]|nr:phage major capsid protein [Neomegalonema sp.]